MAQSRGNLASHHCPFSVCDYVGKSITLLLSHIRTIHSNDPNFFVCCGIDCCCYSARSFPALYSHIYRRHSNYINRRVKPNEQPLSLREEVVKSCLELTLDSDCNQDASLASLEGKIMVLKVVKN